MWKWSENDDYCKVCDDKSSEIHGKRQKTIKKYGIKTGKKLIDVTNKSINKRTTKKEVIDDTVIVKKDGLTLEKVSEKNETVTEANEMIVAKDVVVTKDSEFVVDKESEEINVVKDVIIISTVVKDLDMINEKKSK